MCYLTEEELHWLEKIEGGADIYDRKPADFFRELAEQKPPLVAITTPQHPVHGSLQQPYFGVILTDAGAAVLYAQRKAYPKRHTASEIVRIHSGRPEPAF